MESLSSFLYVSDIGSGCEKSTVTDILIESRGRNDHDNITGLLIFDGKRFAQYVEGPPSAVERLLERLKTDVRHTNMEILWSASGSGKRRFPDWRMGYLKFDLDVFGLEGLRGKRGGAVLDAFTFILPTLDIDTGGAMPSHWGGLAR